MAVVFHPVFHRTQCQPAPWFVHNSGRTDHLAFRDAEPVILDLDDIVARIAARRQGGTAENPGQSGVVQKGVGVPVTSDGEDRTDALEFPGHIEIVQHGSVLRIVINEYGLFARFQVTEPFHAFLRHESRGHPHVRTAAAADKAPALAEKLEGFVAEDFPESVAAALGPLRIVISRDDIVGTVQGIQHILNRRNLLVRPEVGQVSGHHHEIKVLPCVDVADAPPQVNGRTGSFRIVKISHQRKPHGPILRRQGRVRCVDVADALPQVNGRTGSFRRVEIGHRREPLAHILRRQGRVREGKSRQHDGHQ